MRPQRPHSGVLYEMMRAKTALASLSLLLTLSLSGCGSDSALTDYTSQMNTFYDAFSSGTLALEQIDPSSETAQEELLSGLDELTALTASLADISVPKRYADAGIDELAAQAAEHMQEADSLYHEACSAETFDQERASAAQEHYQRAMKQSITSASCCRAGRRTMRRLPSFTKPPTGRAEICRIPATERQNGSVFFPIEHILRRMVYRLQCGECKTDFFYNKKPL